MRDIGYTIQGQQDIESIIFANGRAFDSRGICWASGLDEGTIINLALSSRCSLEYRCRVLLACFVLFEEIRSSDVAPLMSF